MAEAHKKNARHNNAERFRETLVNVYLERKHKRNNTDGIEVNYYTKNDTLKKFSLHTHA